MYLGQSTPDKLFLANKSQKRFLINHQSYKSNQRQGVHSQQDIRKVRSKVGVRNDSAMSGQFTPVVTDVGNNIQEFIKDKSGLEENLSDFFNDDNPKDEYGNQVEKEDLHPSFVAPFYGKKPQTRQGDRMRTTSMSIYPPQLSRSFSAKKKLSLKVSDQVIPLNRSRTGNAFVLFPNNLISVNGRRVSMQEPTNKFRTTQQKHYFRNSKQDSMNVYQSNGKDQEQSMINLSQLLNCQSSKLALGQMTSSLIPEKLPLNKSISSLLNQDIQNSTSVYFNAKPKPVSREDSRVKITTILLDGNYLRPSTRVKTPNIHTRPKFFF